MLLRINRRGTSRKVDVDRRLLVDSTAMTQPLSPVSVKEEHSFYAILGLAIQQQKLLSSPRFGALETICPCVFFPGAVFLFTDAGSSDHAQKVRLRMLS